MATKWKVGDMVLVPAAAIIELEDEAPAMSLGRVDKETHKGPDDPIYQGSILVYFQTYAPYGSVTFWCRPELLTRPRDDELVAWLLS